MRPGLVALACVATLTALPAIAQERSFSFALRGGVAAAPEYPGSENYEPGADLGFTFGSLQWGGRSIGNGVRGTPDPGFALRGALRVIGSRDADDAPELAGLEDIDTAVELGLGVIYREQNWQAFADVRKGVTGHSGITSTVGADWIYRPSDRWLITAGPRMHFGNDEYANTYFGVSEAEAGASAFDSFNAEGGNLGAGVELQGTYFLNDRWALEGAVSYEKLLNDAGDSPITAQGSDDQWRLRIGLSRVFTLNF